MPVPCRASLARMQGVCFADVSRSKGAGSVKLSDSEGQPREQWREGVETRMVVSAANGATQLCILEQ